MCVNKSDTVFDGVNLLSRADDLPLQTKFLSLLGTAKPFECGTDHAKYTYIHTYIHT